MTAGGHRLALALAAASAATVTACASTGPPATIGPVPSGTVAQLAAAGKAVRAQRTSSMSFTEDIKAGGQSVTATGAGAFDYGAGRGHLEVTTPGRGDTTLVITPQTLYAKLPTGSPTGVSTPWIAAPTSSLLSAQGQAQLGAADPTASLDELSALSGVRVVGHERVRGVQTTHYAGTADPRKAIANLSDSVRRQAETAFNGITAVPVDIWLDDDGLPRRFRSHISTMVQGQEVDVTATYELFDFGKPVTVAIPPASQVTTRSSLTG